MAGIHRVYSSYLTSAFCHPKEFLEHPNLASRRMTFDTVVVTGVSGMLLGPIIAYKYDKNLLVVRKPDDSSNHSTMSVEGALGDRWLFVDDQTSSGATLSRVKQAVGAFARTVAHRDTLWIGSYFYLNAEFRTVHDQSIYSSSSSIDLVYSTVDYGEVKTLTQEENNRISNPLVRREGYSTTF
jgi:hypothetical protein